MSFRLSDYEFKAKDHDGYGENWLIDHAEPRMRAAVSATAGGACSRNVLFTAGQSPMSLTLAFRPVLQKLWGSQSWLRPAFSRHLPNKRTREWA